jgi:hypothetical protein
MTDKTRRFSEAIFQLAIDMRKKPTVILSQIDYDEILDELLKTAWKVYPCYERSRFIAYGVQVKRGDE